MRTTPSEHVTQLLYDWGRGDRAALEELLPIVYPELRKLAGKHLRSERAGHTLQPTELIHEAYLRLVEQQTPRFEGRAHFYGVAARLMRQILVDHARARLAGKRGGDRRKVSLDDAPPVFADEHGAGLLALDEALGRLEALDPRKCRVVEMRSFGGMSAEETARALGVSVPTVKRDLRLARAWIQREMQRA
jgi:RNA polymerase sigma-70 factor, ECF subfamily